MTYLIKHNGRVIETHDSEDSAYRSLEALEEMRPDSRFILIQA